MIKAITASTLVIAVAISSNLMADNSRAELRDYYVKLRQESATALSPGVCEPLKNVIRRIEPSEYNYISRYTNSAMAGFEDDLRAKMNELMWDAKISDENKRMICAYYVGRSQGGLKAILDLVDQETIDELGFPSIGEPMTDIERAMQR